MLQEYLTTPISCTYIFNFQVKTVIGQPLFKPLSLIVIDLRPTW